MDKVIKQKLVEMEQMHQVNILFACESGSRAWGFSSPDSDYDVRFIYVHKKDYYLSVDEQRDVIELPINDVLDINGWELRKALRLFRKSNGPLYEWLQSPVIYNKDELFHEQIKALMPRYFSARAAMHHYLSMAKGVFEGELSGDEVRLKKYFYALRPILACQWIKERAEVPPMEFGKLCSQLDKDLIAIVEDLLRQKAEVDEKFMIKKIDKLNLFIKEQIKYCEESVPAHEGSSIDNQPLNELFRKFIL